MKKIFSLLLSLCMLISVFSAFAAAEQTTQTETAQTGGVEVPAPVTGMKDDSAFQGEWKMAQMVMGDQVIDIGMALSMLGSDFPMTFKIAAGKVIAPGADGKTMEENPYVFEDSHLTTEDAQGVSVIYLLEDGRLAIEMTIAAMDGVKIGMLCDRVKAAE